MKIEPTAGRVLVRRNLSEKQKSGLLVPRSALERAAHVIQAVVLEVGPPKLLETGAYRPIQCAVGDTVWYIGPCGWQADTLPDALPEMKDMVVLNEEDVVAIIR
jgi:co-chaperonin GroES (HSP10)